MRYRFMVAIVVILLGPIAASAPLRADGEDNTAAANEAFENGLTAYNSGAFKEALDAFNKAYELKPSWKIYYNIGQSCASLKQWGAALDAFTKYLSQGLDEIPENRREDVENDIDLFKKLVGYLEVHAPDGAKIYVDDLFQGTVPLSSYLTVNARMDLKVRAELIDGSKLERTVMVPNEQTMSIDLATGEISTSGQQAVPGTTQPKETAPTQPTEDTEPAGRDFRPLKIAGWISAGVGVAALLSGAITGGLALGKDADLEKSCGNHVCYRPEYDRLDQLNNLATSSTALFVVGGVATAAGAGLLIYATVKESRERKKMKKSESPKVTFIPTPGGFAMEGRF